MKHLLNNLSEEEKNSIRGQHTGGMQVNNGRFNSLLENKLGNSKPLVSEQEKVQSKEGRNNPVWINFASKLKNVYNPKILTFNSYDTPPLPSQSLNWGTAKSRNGNYAAAILSTDKRLPNEKMELFNSNDRKNQSDMHGWWKQRGYKSDGDAIFINFNDADKFAGDLSEFFKVYPPEKTSGISEQFDDEEDYDFGFESPSCPSCKGNGCEECDGSGMKRNSVVNNDENEPYIDLTDDEDDDIHQIHRKMSSDDEELDEDTSWMNDLNEGDDDYAPTLKEKIEKAIRNSVTNKDEIIDVLEAILREKKGHGHVTKEKVLKNWMK